MPYGRRKTISRRKFRPINTYGRSRLYTRVSKPMYAKRVSYGKAKRTKRRISY